MYGSVLKTYPSIPENTFQPYGYGDTYAPASGLGLFSLGLGHELYGYDYGINRDLSVRPNYFTDLTIRPLR